MSELVNIEINRGDTFDMALRFRDKNEDPIDISSWTIVFTVKEKTYLPDSSANLVKVVTAHTIPLEGKTNIHLTAAETAALSKGIYDYDVQYETPLGEVKTIIYGKINFIMDSNW